MKKWKVSLLYCHQVGSSEISRQAEGCGICEQWGFLGINEKLQPGSPMPRKLGRPADGNCRRLNAIMLKPSEQMALPRAPHLRTLGGHFFALLRRPPHPLFLRHDLRRGLRLPPSQLHDPDHGRLQRHRATGNNRPHPRFTRGGDGSLYLMVLVARLVGWHIVHAHSGRKGN